MAQPIPGITVAKHVIVDELRLRRFARLAAGLLRGTAAQGIGPRAAHNRAGPGLEFLDLRLYAPGDDLRHGKHNAVVAAFGRLGHGDAERAVLEGVWGRADATDDEVLAATKVLSAAEREVKTRLGFLADEARSALATSPFDEEAKQLLEEVTGRLTDRGT